MAVFVLTISWPAAIGGFHENGSGGFIIRNIECHIKEYFSGDV